MAVFLDQLPRRLLRRPQGRWLARAAAGGRETELGPVRPLRSPPLIPRLSKPAGEERGHLAPGAAPRSSLVNDITESGNLGAGGTGRRPHPTRRLEPGKTRGLAPLREGGWRPPGTGWAALCTRVSSYSPNTACLPSAVPAGRQPPPRQLPLRPRPGPDAPPRAQRPLPDPRVGAPASRTREGPGSPGGGTGGPESRPRPAPTPGEGGCP